MKSDTSKSTILVISMGFLALHLIFFWQWAGIVALAVGVVGIVSTFLSKKIERGWMQLSKYMGYIMSHILLSLVFFLFLFPISLLSRLFNKDPLMLSREYRTYFIDINKEMDKASFEKIW